MQDGPTDAISCMEFSPAGTSDLLAVGSWNNEIRLYEISQQGTSQPKALYTHQAPILDLLWSPDSSKVISSGADNVCD